MVAHISALASLDVAQHLRRSPTVVLPFGSIEQHGPHLPCGTDTIAAELVAKEAAEQLDALYVPFGPYGITPIHAGHPGTVSLRRNTFEALLTDVCSELHGMGADTFVLVNWHEGNNAALNAVATEMQAAYPVVFVVAQACYVAQRLYRDEGGELTHGGGIETLAILAEDPELARLERVGEPTRPAGAERLDEMRRSKEVYGFVTDVSEIAEDGWYGAPHWATEERAASFASRVGTEVSKQVHDVLAVHRDRAEE